MKNFILVGVLLALCGFAVYPYVALYQLDQALLEGDDRALRALLDLDAVRDHRSALLRRDTERLIGQGNGAAADFLREGARLLTDQAVNDIVDLDWVRTQLRRDGRPGDRRPYPSLLGELAYAFFESYDRFLIRLGALEDDPTYIRLQWADWRWRVAAIFG